jgi:hypothetical protein
VSLSATDLRTRALRGVQLSPLVPAGTVVEHLEQGDGGDPVVVETSGPV